MGEITKIEWADATFSPWEGCTEIGDGCLHCYARDMNKRWRGGKNWGPGAPRRMTNWGNAFALDRKAEREGRQLRVFPSIMDPFDGEVDDAIRADYFALIAATPHLTHLLLTKRPANAKRWFKLRSYLAVLPNINLGVTVCHQADADAAREIFRSIPVPVKFVSYEPALGLIDWAGWEFVQQIIYGGESGPGSRPANIEWARTMVAWCRAHGVAAFVKQLGREVITSGIVTPEEPPFPAAPLEDIGGAFSVRLRLRQAVSELRPATDAEIGWPLGHIATLRMTNDWRNFADGSIN